jgi:cytoskeleton protein RodZ
MVESNEQPDAADAGERPSPGARLRQARERKGLTLAEAADALRLDQRLLEALEHNDFASLGAPVFAKGHLRKYAMLTGESVDDILLEYHQRVGVQEAPPLVGGALHEAPAVVSRPRRSPGAGLVVSLVLIAGAAAAWWWYEQPVERPAPIGGRAPTAGAVAAPVESEETRAVEALPPAVPDVLAEPTTLAEGEAADAASSATPPPDTASATDVSDEPPAAIAPPPVAAPATTAPARTPSPATGAGGERVLVLTFSSDSWVEVRDAGGARLYYGLGVAGSRRNIRGVPPFEIFLGSYQGVNIELDGEAQRIPAESVRGNTARFTLSPT